MTRSRARRAAAWSLALLGSCIGGFGIFNIGQKQFTCRAKQNEARVNLKSLALLERQYRERTGRYTTSLRELEFAPIAMNYIYGFAIDDDVAHTTGSMVRSRPPRPLGARDLPAETAASKDHFRAGAAGDLHGDDDGLDVWTVDDSGAIENLRDDCRWTKFHAFSGG